MAELLKHVDFLCSWNSSFTFDDKSDVRIFQAYRTKAVLASRLVRKCLSVTAAKARTLMRLGAVWDEKDRLTKGLHFKDDCDCREYD